MEFLASDFSLTHPLVLQALEKLTSTWEICGSIPLCLLIKSPGKQQEAVPVFLIISSNDTVEQHFSKTSRENNSLGLCIWPSYTSSI